MRRGDRKKAAEPAAFVRLPAVLVILPLVVRSGVASVIPVTVAPVVSIGATEGCGRDSPGRSDGQSARLPMQSKKQPASKKAGF